MINLADDVAFEASDYVSFGFSFGRAARDVVDGGLMESHSDYHGAVDRGVQLPVAAVVDSVSATGHS